MTIFRSDDFSPELTLDDIRWVHGLFLEHGRIERAVIQVCIPGKCGFEPTVLRYLNDTPGYDFQLHCWGHHRYFEWKREAIVRDLSAAISYMEKELDVRPTIMHPPWNAVKGELPAACRKLGLTLDCRGAPILRFLEGPEAFGGRDAYGVLFHIKNKNERERIPELLDYFAE